MITRYAFFEGTVKKEDTEAFRAAVMETILPHWKAFPGAIEVRVTFTDDCDEGAPEIPLILAIDYADRATVDAALASDVRPRARAATEEVMSKFFSGRIYHHVTQANTFRP
ncbi:MAG: hypothetical protein AAF615_02455 [Pseudomonadota bacterium]